MERTKPEKPATEHAAQMPSRSVVLALFKKSIETKEKTASIAGEFGERVKNQVENGHLDASAFRMASTVYRKAKSNELKGLATLDQLRFLLEIVEEEVRQGGHAGNLDDMSKREAPKGAAAVAGMGSIDPTGTGALTGKEALRKLRETQHLAPRPDGSAEPPSAEAEVPSVPSAPTEMVDDAMPSPPLRVVGGSDATGEWPDDKAVKAPKSKVGKARAVPEPMTA